MVAITEIKISIEVQRSNSPVPDKSSLLGAVLDPVGHDRPQEVLLLPPTPLSLLLICLLLLPLSDHLLDPLPPLVPLVLRLLPSLLLLVLALVRGHQPSQPRVEGRPIGELFQPSLVVLLGLRRRRSRGLRCRRVGVLVIIIQVVVQWRLCSFKLRLRKVGLSFLSYCMQLICNIVHSGHSNRESM